VDWSSYKKICDKPNVLSRWLLQQTSAVCDGEVKQCIESILKTVPLEKPEDHKGGEMLDMFQTDFSQSQVEDITAQVVSACDAGIQTTGVVERDYLGILRAWQEYERMLVSG
jgi:hypothetical protein